MTDNLELEDGGYEIESVPAGVEAYKGRGAIFRNPHRNPRLYSRYNSREVKEVVQGAIDRQADRKHNELVEAMARAACKGLQPEIET